MNRSADAIQEPLIVLRADRYCIPVRADRRNAVPGILHERSGSGASFFIEPIAAVELNNDLADLLIQEREEIARITQYISGLLFTDADDIREGVTVAGEFDALQACALFAVATDAARPLFSDGGTLHIINGRHPLLDERLAAAREAAFEEEPSDRKVLPITIELDRNACALVVSGPNAGGKTVALKTAGLLVAMAMSGLPVPASDGTTIPVVDALHVLIGDDQSVLEHLSTFSAYLVRLKRIVTTATNRSLVLLDELGSGTDPEEGAALAAATMEHLLEIGALLIRHHSPVGAQRIRRRRQADRERVDGVRLRDASTDLSDGRRDPRPQPRDRRGGDDRAPRADHRRCPRATRRSLRRDRPSPRRTAATNE